MIIFNWLQLKKTREKQKKADSMRRQHDPLFDKNFDNPSELDNFIDHEPSNHNVSIDFLKKHLPLVKLISILSLLLAHPKQNRRGKSFVGSGYNFLS